MKEEFEKYFDKFLLEFRYRFIDFFSSQCSNYDYALEPEETKKFAEDILNNLFADQINMSQMTNETIVQMKKDGVSMGFLLNKSLLYMLENYLLFLNKNEMHHLGYLEKLTQTFSKFSYLFENYINKNIENSDGVIGFGDNNYIYSRNNILDIFQKIKNENKSIKFMNLYQGYPISGFGKIVDIDDEEVVFKMESELQEIAMKLEGKAYILKNKYFHRHVKADIIYSNFSNNTIVLSNFIYLLNLPAVQRKYPRIYPKILIHAKLLGDNHTQIIGNLYDLSQNGIGMISEDNVDFYNGAKIIIEFNVTYSGRKHTIQTTGEIVDILQHMRSYRYCLKIYPDVANFEKISKYIAKREAEIIEELRDELSHYVF